MAFSLMAAFGPNAFRPDEFRPHGILHVKGYPMVKSKRLGVVKTKIVGVERSAG
jgi:hypothetical protein